MKTLRLGLSLLVAVMTVVSLAPAGAAGSRALWIWEEPSQEVIEFAGTRGITDLYIHTPPGFSAGEYEAFIDGAHAAGLSIYATGGDPAWAKHSDAWVDWVNEVRAFGRFDGVVFDVEPHLHPDWGTRRQSRLIRSYLNGLEEATTMAGALPVLTAVPFWWDERDLRVRRTMLVEHVLELSDGIIVMAYRDTAEGPDGIIQLAQTEADLAGRLDRSFMIGVETGPAELDKVSFAEEGSAALEMELATVDSWFTGTPGFGGIAIHHYGAYSTMAP